MKLAIITFPNTGSDTLLCNTIKNTLNSEVEYVRHTRTSLTDYDAILIPGDSPGDSPQTHAQNITSIVITAIKEAAQDNKPIIGIGYGFQILMDIGLLRGRLHCEDDPWRINRLTSLRVENNSTIFTQLFRKRDNIDISTENGHYYHADAATLERLALRGEIVFTFQDRPEGTAESVAGIVGATGNVLGMLPQPAGSTDFLVNGEGFKILLAVKKSVNKAKRMAMRETRKGRRAGRGCLGGVIEVVVDVVLEIIFS